MEVTILGSGAADPQLDRGNACYFVRTDLPILLDFGPGTLLRMMKAGIDRNELTHLFFSHLHADHISEFIPFFFHAVIYEHEHSRRDVTLYGPPGTRKLVESIRAVFPGFDKARFKLEVHEIGEATIRIGQTQVSARPVKHSPGLQALGYRIEHAGRTLVYSGDAVFCPELVELCRGADVAILEATFPEEHPSDRHMTAPQACRVAQEAGVGRLVLTHFSTLWKDYDLKAQCAGRFLGEVVAAEDLMRIQV